MCDKRLVRGPRVHDLSHQPKDRRGGWVPAGAIRNPQRDAKGAGADEKPIVVPPPLVSRVPLGGCPFVDASLAVVLLAPVDHRAAPRIVDELRQAFAYPTDG